MQDKVDAFDKAKAEKQRKAYIGSLIMIFVLAVCIILAIFAWFVGLQSIARTNNGISFYSVDDLNVNYNTYEGTMLSNGEIEYDMTVDWNTDFETQGLPIPEIVTYPGERRYFKTVISNYETRSLRGTVYFENMLVNSKLVTTTQGGDCINFASQVEGDPTKQAFDLINDSTVVPGDIYSRIPMQPFCSSVTLPAATVSNGDTIPTPVTIYWYVTLNGAKVSNNIIPTTTEEVGGETVVTASDAEFIQFKSIRFIAGS